MPVTVSRSRRGERLEAVGARAALALPAAVQRRIAGAPPAVDGAVLHHEVVTLLKLMATNPRPQLDQLPAPQARAEFARSARLLAGTPIAMARVEETTVAGAAGPLRARLYVPQERASDAPGPLLVWLHGGGWAVGDLETHDPACRLLAEHGGVRLLAVDYRLAPEHPFPAPVDDALAAFADVCARPAAFGADRARIAVGGDSAGGQLSAVVAQAGARGDGPAPAFQLLIYPATDLSTRRRSYTLFGAGILLTVALMEFWSGLFAPPGVDRSDPRVSPLLAPDLGAVAPAHVVTAGFDILRDEGEAYAARLREEGAAVTTRRHASLPHAFVNMVGVGRASGAAMVEAAGVLRASL
jgi:acetyl esterase